MRETYSNPNSHYFRYDLNAFLTAARSVTGLPAPRKLRGSQYPDKWYMEKEFSDKPGFQDWYDKKVQQLATDPIMQFIRLERDIAVHFEQRQEVHTLCHTEVVFVDQLNITDGVKMVSTNIEDSTEVTSESAPEISEPFKPAEITTKRTWTFNTNELAGNKEVISVCEQYLAILEALLEDCRKQGYC